MKFMLIAYYRLLQQKFDEDNREDVVVNAVYPCTKHSKIDQTMMPNSQGLYPRGSVIWNTSKVVDTKEKRPETTESSLFNVR